MRPPLTSLPSQARARHEAVAFVRRRAAQALVRDDVPLARDEATLRTLQAALGAVEDSDDEAEGRAEEVTRKQQSGGGAHGQQRRRDATAPHSPSPSPSPPGSLLLSPPSYLQPRSRARSPLAAHSRSRRRAGSAEGAVPRHLPALRKQ